MGWASGPSGSVGRTTGWRDHRGAFVRLAASTRPGTTATAKVTSIRHNARAPRRSRFICDGLMGNRLPNDARQDGKSQSDEVPNGARTWVGGAVGVRTRIPPERTSDAVSCFRGRARRRAFCAPSRSCFPEIPRWYWIGRSWSACRSNAVNASATSLMFTDTCSVPSASEAVQAPMAGWTLRMPPSWTGPTISPDVTRPHHHSPPCTRASPHGRRSNRNSFAGSTLPGARPQTDRAMPPDWFYRQTTGI